MKVPYMNCIACGAQIDGPFEPPHALPPEICPQCGKPPTLHIPKGISEKEVLEMLLKETEGIGDPELTAEIKEKLAEASAMPNTLDLTSRVMKAYQEARAEMQAEQAAVSVRSGLDAALWEAWTRTARWDHHKAILN